MNKYSKLKCTHVLTQLQNNDSVSAVMANTKKVKSETVAYYAYPSPHPTFIKFSPDNKS